MHILSSICRTLFSLVYSLVEAACNGGAFDLLMQTTHKHTHFLLAVLDGLKHYQPRRRPSHVEHDTINCCCAARHQRPLALELAAHLAHHAAAALKCRVEAAAAQAPVDHIAKPNRHIGVRAVSEGEAERGAGGEVADNMRTAARRLHEREGVRCVPHA